MLWMWCPNQSGRQASDFRTPCMVALNLNLGLEHQKNALECLSLQFWVSPAAAASPEHASPEPGGLGAFLTRMDRAA